MGGEKTLREHLKQIAHLGGKAGWKNTTKAERSEKMRNLVKKRWARKHEKRTSKT